MNRKPASVQPGTRTEALAAATRGPRRRSPADRVLRSLAVAALAALWMVWVTVACGGDPLGASAAAGGTSGVAASGDATIAAPGVGGMTVTDLAGRTVELPGPAETVVAIGPGALRLVCYLDGAADVVGIENVEKQWGPSGRPYMLAHPELLELPVIGQGGPDSAPDPEMLLEVSPDVIFAAYLVDAAKADELQSRTGIPVVVLSYGQLGTFDASLLESIRLAGEVMGRDGRALDVVAFIEGCQADLGARAGDVADADEPSVYVGGLGMKGAHGLESSSGAYPPLVALGARNLVDETGSAGSVMIDREKLIVWDPDIILIDEGGLQMVTADYREDPGFYRSLTAVESGSVYGFLPFNYYTTNVDTALADAYFMGTVIYPEEFKDIDPLAKADEIYSFLLGTELYDRMAEDYGGFVKIDFSSL